MAAAADNARLILHHPANITVRICTMFSGHNGENVADSHAETFVAFDACDGRERGPRRKFPQGRAIDAGGGKDSQASEAVPNRPLFPRNVSVPHDTHRVRPPGRRKAAADLRVHRQHFLQPGLARDAAAGVRLRCQWSGLAVAICSHSQERCASVHCLSQGQEPV